MSGYQETLTDPSYHRQVVVQTAPHIGNTGMNRTDEESRRIWVAGYVVREPSRVSSNWRSERSLNDDLIRDGVVGIAGIDTRALTRHLRDAGAMRVGISTQEADVEALLAKVQASAGMVGADLSAEVTTSAPYVVPAVGPKQFTVAALDLGIKGMTPRLMAERGMEVHVMPASSTYAELMAAGGGVDGIFFSNGPGDPATAGHAIGVAQDALRARTPFFGICFGNQLLGRALGFGTYKLRFGHRGINQPVMDRFTGKVEITAQNHGFALDAPLSATPEAPIQAPADADFGRVCVSHVGLNDDVVEGVACLDVPAFSVQYHPEAAAGPHDSAYLFDRFADLMKGVR